MTPPAAPVPARPDIITSAKLPTTKERDPSELQDRLGRNRLIEKVMDKFSGMAGNTTEDFQKYYATIKAMQEEGYECDTEVHLLEEWARISGDTQGKNKTQIIQVLEEKPVLLPGAAGLYPPVEPVPGLIDRFLSWAGGQKGEAK